MERIIAIATEYGIEIQPVVGRPKDRGATERTD
jgi:hypothetical protein